MKLKNKNRFYKLSYFLRKLYSLKLLSFFSSNLIFFRKCICGFKADIAERYLLLAKKFLEKIGA